MTEVRLKTFQLRAELAEIIDRVQFQNTRATITRYGVAVACVVSMREVQELDRLRRLLTAGNASSVDEVCTTETNN